MIVGETEPEAHAAWAHDAEVDQAEYCDEYFDLGEVIAAAEPPLPPLPGRQAVLHSSFYRESIN